MEEDGSTPPLDDGRDGCFYACLLTGVLSFVAWATLFAITLMANFFV